MRPLRDRLAEMIRRSRLNGFGGPYMDLPDDTKDDWRRSADEFLRLASLFQVEIKDAS